MRATYPAISLSFMYKINVIAFRKRANFFGVTYYILWYNLCDFITQSHKMKRSCTYVHEY